LFRRHRRRDVFGIHDHRHLWATGEALGDRLPRQIIGVTCGSHLAKPATRAINNRSRSPAASAAVSVSGKQKPRNLFRRRALSENGAGEETRTLDVHLGKVVLYQLSYARKQDGKNIACAGARQQVF